MRNAPANVDTYIAAQPDEIRIILEQLRELITTTAPDAEEVISYAMPAYKYYGMLVYFAAHTSHTGFYPGAKIIELFKNELKDYEFSKGAIRFPYNVPLPVALIKKLVKEKIRLNVTAMQGKILAKKRAAK